MYEMKSYKSSIKHDLFDQLFDSIDRQFSNNLADYAQYQQDPVGFCRDVLGDTFPPRIGELLEALVHNESVTGQSSNAYGKSYAGARAALWFFFCFPNSQIYVSAAPPETNIRRILWSQILSIFEKHPELTEGLTTKDLHIEKSPTHFITAVTVPVSADEAILEAKSSGKHSENMLWLVDESDGVPDAFYRGVQGCVSGGLSRQLYFFNPRRRSGFIFRSIRDKRTKVFQLDAMWHPSVVSGVDCFPGSVTRESVIRRINEQCRPLAPDELPGSDCYELPEHLIGAVATSQAGEAYQPLVPGFYKIIENIFAYSVLGQYPPADETQLISQAWIDKARSRYDIYIAQFGEKPPQFTRGIAGLDLAEYGGDANALCTRYGNYVAPFRSWDGMDIIASCGRVITECESKPFSIIFTDATGIGAGAAPYLNQRGVVAVPIKVAASSTQRLSEIGEFNRLRDELWWRVRDWLATEQAMLPNDQELIEELAIVTYTVNETGRIQIMRKDDMRKLLQRSPDKADALCLSFSPSGFFSNCDLT